MSDEPIIIEELFDSSVEKIWAAIMELPQMQVWYFPALTSFEPTQGFQTQFIISVEERKFPHMWKVTEVFEMQKISYEWTFAGYQGKGVSSFELSNRGDKSKLVLIPILV